jgi:membrane-bound lytic murein transglycosylase A
MRTFPVAYLGFLLTLAGCAGVPVPVAPPAAAPPQPAPPSAAPSKAPDRPATTPHLRPAGWADLPGWKEDDLVEAWPAWRQSCKAMEKDPAWRRVCELSRSVDSRDRNAIRDFFQRHFQPHEVMDKDGAPWGLVTGYYEPSLRGDRTRTERARYPIYGLPDDLVSVDLSNFHPELKFRWLRGRLVGNRLVPYYTREEIVKGIQGFRATPIAWAEDPVELFYLHIEGSGRIELPDGTRIRVGYAGQNGHPFRSVAKILIEQGELKPSEASELGIKRWGQRNPDRLGRLLNLNPSYIFFRELPDDLTGPPGALGVPLTGGRSVAVDRDFIPLGAPLFLATTLPLSDRPLNRLMLAQDTGAAIRGPVRVDFFWGFGDEAGTRARGMKQTGRKWLLLPRESAPRGP